MTEPIDYKTMYECAAEFARSLIQEANSKDEEIRRLEAEIRELQEQAEELRFNPNHDPKNGRFTSGNGVDISDGSGIIEIGSDVVVLEYQRYGRNKSTVVNKTYIDGGEYRRKFDNISDNSEVNKSVYESAKTALKHRSGTVYEDMYWIDSNTGKVILSVVDSTDERAIVYTDKMKSVIKNQSSIITMHTHPSSMPPSIDDFNSCFNNGYEMGVIACHDGRVFKYSSRQFVSKSLYNLYIGEYLDEGFNEFDAQLKTLEKLKQNHMIDFKEV